MRDDDMVAAEDADEEDDSVVERDAERRRANG